MSDPDLTGYDRLALARPRPSTEHCWLCGVRLPISQMVADGSSASGDVRWYCLDVRVCTERWTTRPARPGSGPGDADAASSQRARAGT